MNGTDLPAINAGLNALSTVFLVSGWFSIRSGHRLVHRNCMMGAFATSTLFLGCYLYHKFVVMRGIHTRFEGPKEFLIPYLILLFSHILLAMAIVPMAMVSMHRAWRERFDAHRRISRWTLPLWLYVSVTGVVIYFLLYRIWKPQ